VENANRGFASSITEHINMILARLTSVGIKFDDEVQALLLLLSLSDSWSGTVTTVTSSAGSDGFTFEKIRDLILGEDVRRRSSENYLVNRYMSSEVRKISEIVGARTKEGVSQRLGIAQV